MSHRARQRRRITCPTCGKALAAGSLRKHMQVQHGEAMDMEEGKADEPARQPADYRVSFPRFLTKIACPVEGCPGAASSRGNLRGHFARRHPQDSLTILEEGNNPLPKCERCGMHVPYRALNSSHLNSATCREGTDRARRRRVLQEVRRAREVVFTAKGDDLEDVSVFRYLGRPLSFMDDDWAAVYRNLKKARARWAQVSRVLAREGADARVSGMFYKAVV